MLVRDVAGMARSKKLAVGDPIGVGAGTSTRLRWSGLAGQSALI